MLLVKLISFAVPAGPMRRHKLTKSFSPNIAASAGRRSRGGVPAAGLHLHVTTACCESVPRRTRALESERQGPLGDCPRDCRGDIAPRSHRSRKPMPLGLPGRLSKGAGTHLASWLQEVSNVPEEEARSWLESPRHERTNEAVAALQHCHGKTVGHAGQILDAAFSGDLLVTKDATSLRLWRARCVVGDQRYCGFFHSICLASVA